jgi:hypothetical protein
VLLPPAWYSLRQSFRSNASSLSWFLRSGMNR